MGEAAASPCLMRSISHPLFASCEFKEGDPLRALTTSVSFGRFMTEPLNWEKWSSFSHNRILEDVKKYSRPGAVAEKKAFFEAHYKNFAAKKAANSPQKENQVPYYSPPLPNTTANISPIAISKAYSSIDDTRENESATLVDGPHIDESMPSSTGVESEIASNEDVGSSSTNLDFLEISNDDNISSTGQVEEEITHVENKRIHIKDAADMDKLSTLAKPEISLLNSSSEYEEYKKLERPPKELAPENVPKKTVTDVMERKRSALQSLHLSMNFSPARKKNGTSKTFSVHKATKFSENEVKKSSQVLPRPENKRSKPVIDCSTNGSRKVALKSLSTNHSVAPNACTKKPKPTTVPSTFSFKCDERASKRKEFFQKLEQRCKVNETQTIQLQPKLKVLENEVKKSSQLLPRPENKRSKPVIDCSTNGSRKVAFLLTYHSEAPSACTKKPRPTTVPSTFSFKCDERAAKRKEFFQKLEQRCKVNETQTIKLQPKLKDKIRSEKNRLRCSTALEAQASTSETKAQSNNVQKHVPKVNGEMPSADEATSDHQRLMDRLQVYDLVELKVSGDGNCQFRSLSDQIYRSSEHHKLVREQVVRQLKCHPELYAAYVPMAYHEYLKKISMAGEWGDHVTLQAAADAFGVKIFVLTSFKDTCYIEILPFAQKSKRIIFLSFWAEVHYNSLYPEGELPTMESTKKKKWWMLGS